MSSNNSRGRRFIWPQTAERPQQEEQMPDPRASSQAWAEWMLLTGQLEQAEDSRC
jgi:hypothetical protein